MLEASRDPIEFPTRRAKSTIIGSQHGYRREGSVGAIKSVTLRGLRVLADKAAEAIAPHHVRADHLSGSNIRFGYAAREYSLIRPPRIGVDGPAR
jgi:hypothetical protein